MEQADSKQRLNPFGGNFQANSKPSRRKAEPGTFTRATRTTKELFPTNYHSTAPEFHSQHSSFVWQHGSVSKKGYTAGFVSQAPRLGSSFRYTGPGPGTNAPLIICVSASRLLHTIGCFTQGTYQAPSWGDKLHSSSRAYTISGPPSAQAGPMRSSLQ